MRDAVVVGGGHNGLVAACYLARAGRDVLVLEALDRPGGGSRTEETVPGFRFDLHSVAHNLIRMTSVLDELELDVDYRELDPFAVAVHGDGRRVRFHRSLEATLASIAETDRREADAYAAFMRRAVPLLRALVPLLDGRRPEPRALLRLFDPALLRSYGALLRRELRSDLARGPVAAFAAHASVGPSAPGGALFALWQAAYHLYGQWHPLGGAQALADALVGRLHQLGGELRCGARAVRIDARGGRVRAVELAGGERIETRAVVTALDPQVALQELLDPPLRSRGLERLRRGNVVQAVLHVATDHLPMYVHAREGDWNGLQSYVDRIDELAAGWRVAGRGRLPEPLPLYAFTTSALDRRSRLPARTRCTSPARPLRRSPIGTVCASASSRPH